MSKQVMIGAKMFFNGELIYSLRGDGWHIGDNPFPRELVGGDFWKLEKNWIDSGYEIKYSKEQLFDKLYEKML